MAEFEGQQFDDYGAMWISDGLGGDVQEVKWIGLETAKRLHKDEALKILKTSFKSSLKDILKGQTWCS